MIRVWEIAIGVASSVCMYGELGLVDIRYSIRAE